MGEPVRDSSLQEFTGSLTAVFHKPQKSTTTGQPKLQKYSTAIPTGESS